MDSAEARRWFGAYLADFVALCRGDLDDVRRILDHYGVPLLLSTDAGSPVLIDETQVLTIAQQQIDAMRTSGYDRSDELASETVVLNNSCASHRVHSRDGGWTAARLRRSR